MYVRTTIAPKKVFNKKVSAYLAGSVTTLRQKARVAKQTQEQNSIQMYSVLLRDACYTVNYNQNTITAFKMYCYHYLYYLMLSLLLCRMFYYIQYNVRIVRSSFRPRNPFTPGSNGEHDSTETLNES
jgi:hypothetical protein